MGIIGVILTGLICAIVGFVAGALVYRNNSKQLGQLTETVIDLSQQVKNLKTRK